MSTGAAAGQASPASTTQRKYGVTLSFTVDVTDEMQQFGSEALWAFTQEVRRMAKESYPMLTNTVISTQEYPND